jgi:hypothetical protein
LQGRIICFTKSTPEPTLKGEVSSELVSSNLREQAEASRSSSQQLSEQAERQQEAGQALARESVEAYAEFLDTAFSRYRAGTGQVAESAQQGARTLADTTTSLVGTATGAAGAAAGATAGATAGAMQSAAETTPALPIAGYDEMNVEEASKRLDELSAEELRLVRDYEERNKGRETLLEQMDRKIRAT